MNQFDIKTAGDALGALCLLICILFVGITWGARWLEKADEAWREEMRLMDEEAAAQEAREEAAKHRIRKYWI